MFKKVLNNATAKSILNHLHPYYQSYKGYRNRFYPPHFHSLEMPLPQQLSLAFTYQCNAACPHCYLRQGNKDIFKVKENINESFLKSIFESPSVRSIQSLSCGGGEALLHPNFFELLDIPIASGIKNIQVVTNGISLMDNVVTQKIINEQEKLSNIQISMDASNQKDYEKAKGIKNCDFDGLFKNIKKITDGTRNNTNFQVTLSFVMTPENISKVWDMINIGVELGIDNCQFLNFHSINHSESEQDHKTILFDEYKQLMRTKNYEINISIQPPLIEKYYDYYCSSLNSLLFVSPSGKLSPCSHIPWDEKYGYFQDNLDNAMLIPEKIEMIKKYIAAYQKKDPHLLPEVCRACNKRSSGLFTFHKEQKKWYFWYWH